jgi:hypothetical protein
MTGHDSPSAMIREMVIGRRRASLRTGLDWRSLVFACSYMGDSQRSGTGGYLPTVTRTPVVLRSTSPPDAPNSSPTCGDGLIAVLP